MFEKVKREQRTDGPTDEGALKNVVGEHHAILPSTALKKHAEAMKAEVDAKGC